MLSAMEKRNWPELMRAIMERLGLTRDSFAKHLGASGKSTVDHWMAASIEPSQPYQLAILAALESMGSGFCNEAVDQFCLGRESLPEILRHIQSCPVCRLAEERILNELELVSD